MQDKGLEEIISYIKEELKPCFKNSMLAHLKTAIEQYSIEKKEIPTSIIYKFINHHFGKKASVKYFQGGYIVYVKDSLPLKEKRYLIGHELSHILISLVENKEIYAPTHRKYDEKREKLASLLSYQFHVDQSNQYKEKMSEFIYEDKNLDNLKQEILNVCGNKKDTNIIEEMNF